MCEYCDNDGCLDVILNSFKLIESDLVNKKTIYNDVKFCIITINCMGNVKDYIKGLFFLKDLEYLSINNGT